MPLHVRGRGLPDEEPMEWWIVDGTLSAEPVKGAETVFEVDSKIFHGLAGKLCFHALVHGLR